MSLTVPSGDSSGSVGSVQPTLPLPFDSPVCRKAPTVPYSFGRTRRSAFGFTLLEVMVAMAIIAIALTAVLGSQSQSVSLAGEAKFNTTASLLAQRKISEIEVQAAEELTDDSGDFGEDFPGYTWKTVVQNVSFDRPEQAAERLRQIDVTVTWGEDEKFQYRLRFYRFVPEGP
jgi:general secretion pathway protein I